MAASLAFRDTDLSAVDPTLGRRRLLQFAGVACITGATIAVPRQARAVPLVPQGYNRYAVPLVDKATNTRTIQAIDLVLVQELLPGTEHLVVMADTVTIKDSLVFPAKNLTIISRRVVAAGGISTRGLNGLPSYTNLATGIDANGATDAGRGQDGGALRIFATVFEGSLVVDTSGGSGGDAQAGGQGAAGTPGAIAQKQAIGGTGGTGHPGGLAGTPGRGGNAGHVLIATESPVRANTSAIVSLGGSPGKPATHGAPGGPGPGGPPNSGTEQVRVMCLPT